MQIVEVNLIEGYPFYCPMTGTLILSEDEFTASAAMVYCYVQSESAFEYTNKQASRVFGKTIMNDTYLDYDEYDEILFSLKKDETAKNWVCFRLCCGGDSIGGYVVDHCIDMGYRK